jgi:CRP-like cAMP-binding protein
MEKVWYLSKTDIFRDLTRAELDVIAERTPMQTVESGTVFFSPEQRTEVLFILKKGRVRMFRISPDGKAFTTAMLEPGTIFGEMAIIGQQMHDQFAEALDPCTICLMSRVDVQQFLLSDPRVAMRIAETLSQRLMQVEQRLSDAVLKNVPQRVLGTILLLARNDQQNRWGLNRNRVEIRFTHEQLAEYVGTYRETVTKILNELRDQGAIELKRGKIIVPDLAALEALAEGGVRSSLAEPAGN